MEKEFIPYEQAVALKELGFDKPCIKYYWTDGMFVKGYENPFNYNKRNNVISAPLYQQAFRWFREKYWLDNAVLKDRYVIETREDLPIWYYGFNTYEEAELACLNKLIEIVKDSK